MRNKGANEFLIKALPKPHHDILEKIEVIVKGKPCDFVVEFRSGTLSRKLFLLGNIMSLFGGGFLVVKGIKSCRNIEKIEDEFWTFLDAIVWAVE